MRKLHAATVIWLVWLNFFPRECHAADKPVVAVRFELREDQYRAHFTQEVSDIENQATSLLLSALTERIGFVTFTTQRSPLELRFIFDDKNTRDSGALREVGFHIQLVGTGTTTAAHTYWKYSDAEAYQRSFGTLQSFVGNLRIYLKTSADYDRLVQEVLRYVPIDAHSGAVLKDPEIIWIIPYQPEYLHLDLEGSIFWVENTVRSRVGIEIRKLHVMHTGIFLPEQGNLYPNLQGDILGKTCLDTHPEEKQTIDRLLQDDRISVSKVFVQVYKRRNPKTEGPLNPDAAFPSHGGRP
jgi:hypothetical protein